MTWQSRIRALAVLSSACALSPDATAFCRTRTCEFRNDVACPRDTLTGCYESGAFVYWETGCIPYAVQRDGSAEEGITALQVAELLDQGFRIWSDLGCAGGRSPELATSRQGLIACGAVEFNCNAGAGNSNLVTFRDAFGNTDIGLGFGVIALTTVTANLVSGEILDADIELNSRDEDFELSSASPSPRTRDLNGVINHELGHLLGLSHSNERGALMRALYEGSTAPSSDDAAGMCAALGASAGDPACVAEVLDPEAACLGSDITCTSTEPGPEDRREGGCALRQPRARRVGPGAWGWAVGLALWALRRKSQVRQRVL